MKLKNGGYTKLEHQVTEALLKIKPHSAAKVGLFIFRQTIGWQKAEDKISFSQIRKATGLSNDPIGKALTALEGAELITKVPTQGPDGMRDTNLIKIHPKYLRILNGKEAKQDVNE